MKNFRINIAEKKGYVNHCWIERKRFFMWFSITCLKTIEGEFPIPSLYTFDDAKKAEDFLKEEYRNNYSIITRRIIL